jgi:cytoskeletal protein RodZ
MNSDRDPRFDHTSTGHSMDPTRSGMDPVVSNTDPMPMNRTGSDYGRDRRGSNFLAYLIGGLVIAVGLLAFLFYDGRSGNDPVTTGSTGSSVSTPVSPSTGSTGSTGTSGTSVSPAPASPMPPATPAR